MSATILKQWAGHNSEGNSDKVWAACLTSTHEVITRHGKRGTNLITTPKQFDTAEAAQKHYQQKVDEKSLKNGYVPATFDDPEYGIPSFDQNAPVTVSRTPQTPVHQVTLLTSVTLDDLVRALTAGTGQGITEKINGARTILESDGHALRTYNRTGLAAGQPPTSTHILQNSGRSFVIDGERFATPENAGAYAAFDLLALDGTDCRALPFSERIEVLENFLTTLGVIHQAVPALGWKNNENGQRLVLLKPTGDLTLVEWLRGHGREGVVLRDPAAPYQIGAATSVRRYKFRADLDAVVTGIKPGTESGSLKLGLVRPSTGEIVDIGHVSNGLTTNDMAAIADMLNNGQRPVITVGYLPVRTTTKLVEPTTAFDMLRQDKLPEECTTDQLPGLAD